MAVEVWILGGTGRSGQAIATAVRERDLVPVLVGRDSSRLARVAAQVGAGRTVTADSVEAIAAEITRCRPTVVINTIGPFTSTSVPLARACLAGSHYLDLANDIGAVLAVLGLHDEAQTAGLSLVTGAGFGVTATESVVVALCAGRRTPADVRVDMVPSLETSDGVIGEALAATILSGLPGVPGGGRFAGRRFRDGRLVSAGVGDEAQQLSLPDGSTVTTAVIPLGELIAAQRASGAPSVVAASSEAPSSPIFRAVFPLAGLLLSAPPVQRFAVRRLASVKMTAKPRPREHSWGHARISWPDGTVREGWLRVGEAQAFTGAVPAEAARRLLAGEGKAGAFTPAALFGTGLVEACGGQLSVDDVHEV